MKYPILFIHGFGGTAQEYSPIIQYLKSFGQVVHYDFSYNEKFGQISLRDIARELNVFVEKNISGKEFDIVALSQGGNIARYYIKHFARGRVRKCVTVCTPHKGSLLAYIGIFPGIRDLQPSSTFLGELDTEHAEYYAVFNPLDLMVFPGWNAKLSCAKENKCVWSLSHPLTFTNRVTHDFILSSLF